MGKLLFNRQTETMFRQVLINLCYLCDTRCDTDMCYHSPIPKNIRLWEIQSSNLCSTIKMWRPRASSTLRHPYRAATGHRAGHRRRRTLHASDSRDRLCGAHPHVARSGLAERGCCIGRGFLGTEGAMKGLY